MALSVAVRRRTDVRALFFDYGQPYARQENEASAAVAAALGVPLRRVRMDNVPERGGVFVDRNERFVAFAALYCDEVWFGCRWPLDAGDTYGDSNAQWARRVARRHRVAVRTPALLHPKFLVKMRTDPRARRHVFSSEGWVYGE